MNEKDAHKKYCPLNGIMSIIGDASNTKVSARCDGADCMFWRWSNKNMQNGYCGLAGKEQGAEE